MNVTDYKNEAINLGRSPELIGYLTAFPKRFEIAPTYTWNRVSDALLEHEKDEDDTALREKLTSRTNDIIAHEILFFRTASRVLPRIEDILNGTATAPDLLKQDISLMYAASVSVLYELQDRANKRKVGTGKSKRTILEANEQWLTEAGNAFQFMLDNFTPEVTIMAVKAAIQVHRLPINVEMPVFKAILDTYGDVIKAATGA